MAANLSAETVEKAVKALLKWRASKSEASKPQLLEQDEFIYLILTLKKIPQKGVSRINPHKIPLPHPLIDRHASELCLIIDDRPKSGLTKDAAKKKIQNDDVPISKIIGISKLKSDYRAFEAKRKLCDSYDMFLADKRVVPLLPKVLGKQFFKKKKIPVLVDLRHKNWKEQVEKACESGLLFLSSGTCSVVKVGRVSMEREAIVENVVAAIGGIVEVVPRKWGGIRSFHLKLLESLALPVYQALPDLKLRIESGKGEGGGVVEEEMVREEKVVGRKKQKGRIHDVKYMDNNKNVDEVLNDDDAELESDGEGVINENNANAEMGSGELENKKRKMGEKRKAAKREMVTKVKQKDGLKQKKRKDEGKNEDSSKKKKQKEEGLALGKGKMKDKKMQKKKLVVE